MDPLPSRVDSRKDIKSDCGRYKLDKSNEIGRRKGCVHVTIYKSKRLPYCGQHSHLLVNKDSGPARDPVNPYDCCNTQRRLGNHQTRKSETQTGLKFVLNITFWGYTVLVTTDQNINVLFQTYIDSSTCLKYINWLAY